MSVLDQIETVLRQHSSPTIGGQHGFIIYENELPNIARRLRDLLLAHPLMHLVKGDALERYSDADFLRLRPEPEHEEFDDDEEEEALPGVTVGQLWRARQEWGA